MNYRKHQAEIVKICEEILEGAPVKQIIASVTPGGGKSKIPVIIADMLIPKIATKVVWIAPRNSLKYQGEAEFIDERFPTNKRLRATEGNEKHPCRGTDGYLTTYQAVGINPQSHIEYFNDNRVILFLDEGHHVADGATWSVAIEELRKRAVLVVDASGTLSRGDGQKIHGLEYADGRVDLSHRESIRVVRYSRIDALKESAIIPVRFKTFDGRAEWADEAGIRTAADVSTRDYTAQALFTALRTEFAIQVLECALIEWKEYRRDEYSNAKLLVVAPSIKYAEEYYSYLQKKNEQSLIATSADTESARDAIDRFKGIRGPETNILVTCQLAYEGLSVPAITHVACLTHIRSVPWLEQCFARANRTAPGKKEGFIYGPKDVRFLSAIRAIEAEQVLALKPSPESEEKPAREVPEFVEGTAKPWITPIGSEAYRAGGVELETEERPDGGMTPKEAERLLRTQIADHIDLYLSRCRPGSKAAYSSIIHRKLKAEVGGKPREDCTVIELTKQWALLKEGYPV